MQVVIPAAGIGSRFLPVTRVIPKELLLLGSLPLLHHALLEAEAGGFDRAVVVIAPWKQALRTYLQPDPTLEARLAARGDQAGLERLRSAAAIAARLRVTFVEQPDPRGLGDAVLRGAPRGQPFGVLLPDDVIPTGDHWLRLRRLSRRTGGPALYVRRVRRDQVHRFGVAHCAAQDGALRVRRLVEKPAPGEAGSDLVVFGRYIVTPEVLPALVRRAGDAGPEIQLTDGLSALVDRPAGVWAAEFRRAFYDCGTPADYARSVARWRSERNDRRSRR